MIEIKYNRSKYHITSIAKGLTLITFDEYDNYIEFLNNFSDYKKSFYFKAKFKDNLLVVYPNVEIIEKTEHFKSYSIRIKHDKVKRMTIQEIRYLKINDIFND
jgi:hypothetical protein